MIMEIAVGIEEDKILEEASVMTDMTAEIGIGVEQEKGEMTEDMTVQMQV